MMRFLAGAFVAGFAIIMLANGGPSPSSPNALEIRADGDGQYVTPCAFNNVEMRCVVDTGATGTALDRRAAAWLGIDVRRLRFTGRSETANGMARIACGLLVTLRVGPLTHTDFPVCIIDSDMHGIPLLGMSFLRRHRVEMEDGTLVISE